MKSNIEPKHGILDIVPYVSGASSIPGRAGALKMSSNENPYGSSKRAAAAYRDALGSLSGYPSSSHFDLRKTIGYVQGLNLQQIVCGAGSDELIGLLCHAFSGPGDEVVYSRHGFLMFPIQARAAGATPVEAEERERRVDVDCILDVCTSRTRLVFIANPNNPTGTMIGNTEVCRLADRLPGNAVLVLDGAYVEYAQGWDGGVSAIQERENVVMTRTFSKIHGLASLRIGYAYGPKRVIEAIDRIRAPFNVAGPSLAAAEAAIRDVEHVKRCQAHNSRWRNWLSDSLAAIGVPSDRSHANFLLARFADGKEAEMCDTHLKECGIIVRRMEQYKLPHCLRITVGTEQACRRVVDAVTQFRELTA